MHDLKGKNVLVTGATGLLGRPLVDKLIRRGAHVDGVGIERTPFDWPENANYASLDLSDRAQWEGVLYQIDYVFHLAGAKGGVGIGRTRAADFMRGNCLSTLHLFSEWMSEPSPPSRLLFTSSVGAYPGDKAVFHEDDLEVGPPHQSDYFGGYSKRFGEVLCKAYREQHGLDYVVVRPTNCFGPYDRFDPETGMVVAALIARLESQIVREAITSGQPLEVWGDGTARRDFLYSKDAAEQMIMVMERGAPGEAYNLGTGDTISIKDLLVHLSRFYLFNYKFLADKPSGPSERKMSMAKTAALGPVADTPLHDALLETINWYRANPCYQKYDPFKK